VDDVILVLVTFTFTLHCVLQAPIRVISRNLKLGGIHKFEGGV